MNSGSLSRPDSSDLGRRQIAHGGHQAQHRSPPSLSVAARGASYTPCTHLDPMRRVALAALLRVAGVCATFCGGHVASSCAACAAGHGAESWSWCHGECIWVDRAKEAEAGRPGVCRPRRPDEGGVGTRGPWKHWDQNISAATWRGAGRRTTPADGPSGVQVLLLVVSDVDGVRGAGDPSQLLQYATQRAYAARHGYDWAVLDPKRYASVCYPPRKLFGQPYFFFAKHCAVLQLLREHPTKGRGLAVVVLDGDNIAAAPDLPLTRWLEGDRPLRHTTVIYPSAVRHVTTRAWPPRENT